MGSMKRKNASRPLTVEQFYWECLGAAKLPLEAIVSDPVPTPPISPKWLSRRLSENRLFSKSLVCKLLIYKGLSFKKL